jgi:hypothetical protein
LAIIIPPTQLAERSERPFKNLVRKEFAAKEKLEIVIGAAKPLFAGAFPRRRRQRKSSELF